MAKNKKQSKNKNAPSQWLSKSHLLGKYGISEAVFDSCLERSLIPLATKSTVFGTYEYEDSPAAGALLTCLALHPISIRDYREKRIEEWDQLRADFEYKFQLENDGALPDIRRTRTAIGSSRPRRLRLVPFYNYLVFLLLTRNNYLVREALDSSGLDRDRKLLGNADIEAWREALLHSAPEPIQRALMGQPLTEDSATLCKLYLQVIGIPDITEEHVLAFRSITKQPFVKTGIESLFLAGTTVQHALAIIQNFYGKDLTQDELSQYAVLFFQYWDLTSEEQAWYLSQLSYGEAQQKRDATSLEFNSYMVRYAIPTQGGAGDVLMVIVEQSGAECIRSKDPRYAVPEDIHNKRLWQFLRLVNAAGINARTEAESPFKAMKRKSDPSAVAMPSAQKKMTNG